MNRQELLVALKKKIKSFDFKEYNDISTLLMKDETGNIIEDSILVCDSGPYPWNITDDFSIGIETEFRGNNLKTVKYKPNNNFKQCCINITDFSNYGNYHSYGEVTIENVTWLNIETGVRFSSTELLKEYPKASTHISWNVRRILFDDDLTNGKGDWSDYETGIPTERFDSYDELLLTAIYTIVKRIEGPIRIQNSDICCYEKLEDMLVIIDENDNVIIRKDIEKILTKNK